MNAKELRIGNWVNVPHGNVQILRFIDNGVHLADGCGSNFNALEPILLTPEILEKCGFVDGIGETKEWKWNDYVFHITKDGFVYTDSWYKQNFIPIKYLHQLQNLYFSLTGEELEVNL